MKTRKAPTYMTPSAVAIYAAQNTRHGQHWGPYAAIRFCERRGVPKELYFKALRMEHGQ